LRDIKVDAVIASVGPMLAVADDGRVYAWGDQKAAASGALGLGTLVSNAAVLVPTPQCIPGLRVGM
jgi:alpha-tubulin suppressor-like RCC1 family protein